MCGSHSITVDKSTIEYHFNAKFVSGQIDFESTYNAAPSQLLPIITTYAPTAISLGKLWRDNLGENGAAIRMRSGSRTRT